MVASFFTAFDPQLKITVREGKVFDAQDERIRAVCALPEVEVFTETLEENAMVQYKDRQAMVVLKGEVHLCNELFHFSNESIFSI